MPPAAAKRKIAVQRDALADLEKAPPVLVADAVNLRTLFVATLQMLQARSAKYVVDELIASIGRVDPEYIQTAFVLVNNRLRDLIGGHYRSQIPSMRVLMSTLVVNDERAETHTALFFPERKNTQVSKQLVSIFFAALSELKSTGIRVNEIIIVTQAPLSQSSRKDIVDLNHDCFLQEFKDSEILAPATDSWYSPKIRVLTDEEQREFFVQNPRFKHDLMQQISHTDALMKYLGVRPRSVVEILRPEIIPGNLRATELTYAWVGA